MPPVFHTGTRNGKTPIDRAISYGQRIAIKLNPLMTDAIKGIGKYWMSKASNTCSITSNSGHVVIRVFRRSAYAACGLSDAAAGFICIGAAASILAVVDPFSIKCRTLRTGVCSERNN